MGGYLARTPEGPRPEVESCEDRQLAVARLRDMSREDRLAMLMKNFSGDCAELGGSPRRGAAAPRKSPAPRRD